MDSRQTIGTRRVEILVLVVRVRRASEPKPFSTYLIEHVSCPVAFGGIEGVRDGRRCERHAPPGKVARIAVV